MPYTTAYHQEDKNDPYWVINSDTGEPVGKHPTRREQTANLRALYANVPEAKEVKMIDDATVEATPLAAPVPDKAATESFITRIINALKEGRRNNTADQSNIQAIHDLAVKGGADCPMIFKQASGAYRWILFSTNSYQDRDGEIVSQKAQEADVERMNQSGNFGPLRLWHLGYPDVAQKEAGPGLDVGVCDYSQMMGRIRVESGTFTDNRVGAAIKARPDHWLSSIGFFHPTEQPDREGVYQDSYTFERSLLPRAYASNPLTPLAAILKENDPMKQEDKLKQLGDLLGDPALADTVLKQAEATEKAAQERGLKYKAADALPENKEVDKPADEPEKDEPAAPVVDYEAMAKGLAPFFEKMIEAKMSGATKERTDKEASMAAQITTLEAALKETRKTVDVLNSDLPRGVQRFLASEASATVAPDGKYKGMETPAPDPMGTIFAWLAQPVGVPPVQSTPEK